MAKALKIENPCGVLDSVLKILKSQLQLQDGTLHLLANSSAKEMLEHIFLKQSQVLEADKMSTLYDMLLLARTVAQSQKQSPSFLNTLTRAILKCCLPSSPNLTTFQQIIDLIFQVLLGVEQSSPTSPESKDANTKMKVRTTKPLIIEIALVDGSRIGLHWYLALSMVQELSLKGDALGESQSLIDCVIEKTLRTGKILFTSLLKEVVALVANLQFPIAGLFLKSLFQTVHGGFSHEHYVKSKVKCSEKPSQNAFPVEYLLRLLEVCDSFSPSLLPSLSWKYQQTSSKGCSFCQIIQKGEEKGNVLLINITQNDHCIIFVCKECVFDACRTDKSHQGREEFVGGSTMMLLTPFILRDISKNRFEVASTKVNLEVTLRLLSSHIMESTSQAAPNIDFFSQFCSLDSLLQLPAQLGVSLYRHFLFWHRHLAIQQNIRRTICALLCLSNHHQSHTRRKVLQSLSRPEVLAYIFSQSLQDSTSLSSKVLQCFGQRIKDVDLSIRVLSVECMCKIYHCLPACRQRGYCVDILELLVDNIHEKVFLCKALEAYQREVLQPIARQISKHESIEANLEVLLLTFTSLLEVASKNAQEVSLFAEEIPQTMMRLVMDRIQVLSMEQLTEPSLSLFLAAHGYSTLMASNSCFNGLVLILFRAIPFNHHLLDIMPPLQVPTARFLLNELQQPGDISYIFVMNMKYLLQQSDHSMRRLHQCSGTANSLHNLASPLLPELTSFLRSNECLQLILDCAHCATQLWTSRFETLTLPKLDLLSTFISILIQNRYTQEHSLASEYFTNRKSATKQRQPPVVLSPSSRCLLTSFFRYLKSEVLQCPINRLKILAPLSGALYIYFESEEDLKKQIKNYHSYTEYFLSQSRTLTEDIKLRRNYSYLQRTLIYASLLVLFVEGYRKLKQIINSLELSLLSFTDEASSKVYSEGAKAIDSAQLREMYSFCLQSFSIEKSSQQMREKEEEIISLLQLYWNFEPALLIFSCLDIQAVILKYKSQRQLALLYPILTSLFPITDSRLLLAVASFFKGTYILCFQCPRQSSLLLACFQLAHQLFITGMLSFHEFNKYLFYGLTFTTTIGKAAAKVLTTIYHQRASTKFILFNFEEGLLFTTRTCLEDTQRDNKWCLLELFPFLQNSAWQIFTKLENDEDKTGNKSKKDRRIESTFSRKISELLSSNQDMIESKTETLFLMVRLLGLKDRFYSFELYELMASLSRLITTNYLKMQKQMLQNQDGLDQKQLRGIVNRACAFRQVLRFTHNCTEGRQIEAFMRSLKLKDCWVPVCFQAVQEESTGLSVPTLLECLREQIRRLFADLSGKKDVWVDSPETEVESASQESVKHQEAVKKLPRQRSESLEPVCAETKGGGRVLRSKRNCKQDYHSDDLLR